VLFSLAIIKPSHRNTKYQLYLYEKYPERMENRSIKTQEIRRKTEKDTIIIAIG